MDKYGSNNKIKMQETAILPFWAVIYYHNLKG